MTQNGGMQENYSVGRLAELACLLEVTASKPGNVHRGADFEDVTFVDFASSAIAMGQAIDETGDLRYGATVLKVAERTWQMVGTNTNLGINLLITAMAKVAISNEELSRKTISEFLSTLDADDAVDVFQAIRIMHPGGLGEVESNDVNASPTASLLDAMHAARDRDLIAAQFGNGFREVFHSSLPAICEGEQRLGDLMPGIVWAHVKLMAEFPDSLIQRKNGSAIALQSQARAARCLEAMGSGGAESFFHAVSDFDFWLRSDGHRRNPGTTADLIAAGLFVGLVRGDLEPRFR